MFSKETLSLAMLEALMTLSSACFLGSKRKLLKLNVSTRPGEVSSPSSGNAQFQLTQTRSPRFIEQAGTGTGSGERCKHHNQGRVRKPTLKFQDTRKHLRAQQSLEFLAVF